MRFDPNGRRIMPPKPASAPSDSLEADVMTLLPPKAGEVTRAAQGNSATLRAVHQTTTRYQNHRVLRENGISPAEWAAMFQALVKQESGFNPRARSSKGAVGLAQLMPATAAKLRVDPHDPMQNLDGGARYLLMQIDTFRSPLLALAAYNAGPGAVQKYRGVPPYRETRDYVVRVLAERDRILRK